MGPGSARGIQSIEVGHRILMAMQMGPLPLTLKEIADRAGLSSSAAHNYLSSFIRIGFVEAEGRGSYRFGPALASLGLSALNQFDGFDVVRNEAITLSNLTERGVAVLVFDKENGPIIIFHKQGVKRGAFDLRNGLVSILRTGGGNIFIAYLKPDETAQAVCNDGAREGLSAQASATLAEQIRRDVIEAGYAISDLRELPGYSAISAAVWDPSGVPRYALTLTGPKDDIDAHPDGPQVRALLTSARRLSRYLGAPSRFWSDAGARPAKKPATSV